MILRPGTCCVPPQPENCRRGSVGVNAPSSFPTLDQEKSSRVRGTRRVEVSAVPELTVCPSEGLDRKKTSEDVDHSAKDAIHDYSIVPLL